MKCIKDKKGEITRVSEDIAWEKVARKNYVYCSKSEWRRYVVQKDEKKQSR
jgi:hypothetical protein